MGRKGTGNLCRAVTDQLGRRIVAGEIPPGAALPTELAMATELGVSRTTVREAMKRLNGKGVVYGGPRHGMRVQPPAEWNQFDSELLAWRMESGESDTLLDQLYEIRNCFEPRACAIAAERASEADRRAIVAHYEAMQRASSNAAACVAADLEFHLAVFAATGNIFFVFLGASIATALCRAFRLSQERQQISESEMRLHGDVCAAIYTAQPEPAERAMRRLLQLSRQALADALHG